MAGLLGDAVEEIEPLDDLLTRNRFLELRERLSGAIGAEEGRTSTPELRARAARDYAEAADMLDLDEHVFEPPAGHLPWSVSVERDLDSFRRPWPKTGDRC